MLGILEGQKKRGREGTQKKLKCNKGKTALVLNHLDELSIIGSANLAVDTTVVSALHANGEAQRNAARRGGVVLDAARRRRELSYPELTARGGRARLVVLGFEVGGRGVCYCGLGFTRQPESPNEHISRKRGKK